MSQGDMGDAGDLSNVDDEPRRTSDSPEGRDLLDLERLHFPIPVARVLRGGPDWTVARIRDSLVFAEAYHRPIGLETVRAMAASLLMNVAHEVTIAEAFPALTALAATGDLGDADQLMRDLGALPDGNHLTLDTFEYATWLAAIEGFLDTVPARRGVWTRTSDRTCTWIDLVGTEAEIRAGLGPHTLTTHFPVLGHTGLPGLTPEDVRQHEMSLRHRTDPDFDLGAQERDPKARRNDSLKDLWAWHHLCLALDEHGVAYSAYLAADDGALKFSAPFDRVYQGPVESIEAFCFGIGMRDGWWLQTEALSRRYGLDALLEVDTDTMWELYELLGWRIARDHLGSTHLFQPPRHQGPAPSVREVIAGLREGFGRDSDDPPRR